MQDHSERCKYIMNQKFENYQSLNEEISNYKNFREHLIEFLKLNPIITYREFTKEAQKIYDENKCNFEIKKNTFSNIFYEWRKKSNTFSKFSIFDNKYTHNHKLFLRDYTFKGIYSKNGKNIIEHEHIIYASDFYIKKMSESPHFYIDGTFVYPSDFKQLIVILYYDLKFNKRFPGVFALINNKTEPGYIELFTSIYNIITIEKTEDIKLESYTTDFEDALMNALELIFPGKRKVGCYFHYARALRTKKKNLGMLKKDKEEESNKILISFLNIPFKIDDNFTEIDSLCDKYNDYCPQFINYFINQWVKYFKNGSLNYKKLNKSFRSNSYIENYNRRIKLKLSKYLYGKSKTKISWPLFHHFILQEEEEYRKDYISNEESMIIKKNNNEFSKKGLITQIKDNKNLINLRRKWLKLFSYSCRYDTFMFLYTFIIKLILEKKRELINSETDSLNLYNNMSKEILQLTDKELDNGIWNIIDNYKGNNSFLHYGYKQYYSITQLFTKFEKNSLFCIKYISQEGCSNCTKQKTYEKYLNPIINFDNSYINMFNITDLIKNLIKNETSVCPKCGYYNEKIIDENDKNYYRIVTNVEFPMFLFIGFDFSIGADIVNNSNITNSLGKQNLLAYNRLKHNLNLIKNLILDKITINNNIYVLKGLVSTPYSGHYNGIITDLNEDIYPLKKGKYYFYDGQKNNNEIIEIENWRELLNTNLPYILFYNKN